jgi:hypothetical protein
MGAEPPSSVAAAAADDDDVVEHWRFRRFGRWLSAAVFAALSLTFGIDALLNHPEDRLFAAFVALVYAVGWYFGGQRPFVTLHTDRLVVRNPLRTRLVPLAELQRVDPGYSGLELTLRDGSHMKAWALQVSNAVYVLNLNTRAHRAATAIRACAGLPDWEAELEARKRGGRDFFDDVPRPRRGGGCVMPVVPTADVTEAESRPHPRTQRSSGDGLRDRQRSSLRARPPSDHEPAGGRVLCLAHSASAKGRQRLALHAGPCRLGLEGA